MDCAQTLIFFVGGLQFRGTRPEHFRRKRNGFEVLDSKLSWASPSNFSRAEEHVPNEKEVPVVPPVVSHAILLMQTMVHAVSGRGGDEPFKKPNNGTRISIFMQRTIPRDAGVGANYDRHF